MLFLGVHCCFNDFCMCLLYSSLCTPGVSGFPRVNPFCEGGSVSKADPSDFLTQPTVFKKRRLSNVQAKVEKRFTCEESEEKKGETRSRRT